MKKISTIISDFDGTILKSGAQTVDPVYFDLIRRLQQKGIRFIAASGREYSSMKYLLEPIKDDISFICLNGSMIAQGEEILSFRSIASTVAAELIADMQTIPGTQIVASGEQACYMVTDEPDFVRMLREKVHNNVICLNSFAELTVPLSKISIHWHTGIPEKEKAWFRAKYETRLSVVDGGGGWLDFTNLGVDKGSALRLLAEKQGWDPAEAVSFGDSENDITMLQTTGISYAMNTAKDHVKACAQYECDLVADILGQLCGS